MSSVTSAFATSTSSEKLDLLNICNSSIFSSLPWSTEKKIAYANFEKIKKDQVIKCLTINPLIDKMGNRVT